MTLRTEEVLSFKKEALDRTTWRNHFGGGFEPVVRQNTEWMNEYDYTSQSPVCIKMSIQNVFNVVHDYNATHHSWDGELGTPYFTCVNMVCMNVLIGITDLYWLLIFTYICIGAVPCEYMNWDTLHLLGVRFVSSCWVAFRVLHICLHFECKMAEFFSCDSKMYV